MHAVGLSPALGTFLGGVVLANSEYRHELESDIEPFKGLLLGIILYSGRFIHKFQDDHGNTRVDFGASRLHSWY